MFLNLVLDYRDVISGLNLNAPQIPQILDQKSVKSLNKIFVQKI